MNILSTPQSIRKNYGRAEKERSLTNGCGGYTTYMNEVYRTDQLKSSYSTAKRAAKRWKCLFWFLVDISIINDFIMIKVNVQQKVSEGLSH